MIKNWLGSLFKFQNTDGTADEELIRAANMLNQLIWAIAAVCLITIPLVLMAGSRPVIAMVILISLGIDLICYALMRMGKIRLASLLLILATWAVFALATLAQGGLESVLSFVLVAFVILAGLLVNTRFAIGMAILNILAYTVMLLVEVNGLTSEPVSPITPFTRWSGLVSISLLISFLFYLAIKNLRSAIDRSRQNELELRESNRELQMIRSELETRVAERTQDLEQRARQLQVSAEIASAVASIRDLGALLEKITILVSERLGFYHVGLFLLDEGELTSGEMKSGVETLVLRATNSPAGKLLVEKGYRLTKEQSGVVGVAARTLQPHITSDVQQDPFYVPLPELSETRLEVAFPLAVGGKLFGALDMHDSQGRMLGSQDIAILQTLADQIAIAIENAQLFEENQSALETVQRAYGELTKGAWQRLLRSKPEMGYLCTAPGKAIAVTSQWSPEMIQARKRGSIVEPHSQESGSILALPIKIRDQVIGVVKLRKRRDSGKWTADEIDLMETIGDQLSVALESARLYDETRRRAERERLTGEITARLRASNDPRAILQTAVHELRQALQADRAQIMLHVPHSGERSNEVDQGHPPEEIEASKNGAQSAQEVTSE